MPDSVRIHALRIAAPVDCRAGVAAALERADWSLAAEQEVLFLRRIRVGGPLPEVGRLALQQARHSAAGAVDGWRSDAEQAEAVRFASRGEMLACLLRDLLHAQSRWFWRGWQTLFALPAGAAIVRLMQAEALHWPAVMHHLARIDAAAMAWQSLSDDDARLLLHTLQQATGWRLAQTSPARPLGNPPSTPATRLASNPATASRLPSAARAAPAWLRVLAASRTTNDDARLRLAIVTWLWQEAPQNLAGADAGERIARWVDELAGGMRQDSHAMPTQTARPTLAERQDGMAAAPPAGKTGSPVAAGGRTDAALGTDAALPEQASPEQANPKMVAADGTSQATTPEKAKFIDTDTPARDGQPAPTLRPDQAPAMARQPVERLEIEPQRPAAEATCITRQGGWFLLLNVLSLPTVQSLLQSYASDAASAPGSGWLWLYRLGRAFGGEADPPLARFLAAAAGLPGPPALLALPPSPDTAELMRLARQRYGAALLSAELFAQPALVLATRSHLDVHFRMADIRLDVRRAALDINPGWLPWLGRVVNFHYGHAPELSRT